MRKHWMHIGRIVLILIGMVSTGAMVAAAQTSVGLSFYGAFSGRTSASGVTESPANSAGGLVELRHISNPIVGFEGTYSFNRANQTFSCGLPCGTINKQTVSADAHELTVDWVPSVHIANMWPFGVLGLGALVNVPQGGTSGSTQTSTKAVYVYGAGLDWGLLPHIGLRLQYRGNLYKAPDVSKLYTSVDSFTHTAEPMIGVYFSM